MANTELHKKLRSLLSEVDLDLRPLGRDGRVCIWIESKALLKVAKALRGSSDTSSDLSMDLLENLSCMEVDGSLVISYFLGSSRNQTKLVIRITLELKNPNDRVSQVESVSSIWEYARYFEFEISELFGVDFRGAEKPPFRLMAEGWKGYPLRKSYEYPQRWNGIEHDREATKPRTHPILRRMDERES